jgi:hypothetical protein
LVVVEEFAHFLLLLCVLEDVSSFLVYDWQFLGWLLGLLLLGLLGEEIACLLIVLALFVFFYLLVDILRFELPQVRVIVLLLQSRGEEVVSIIGLLIKEVDRTTGLDKVFALGFAALFLLEVIVVITGEEIINLLWLLSSLWFLCSRSNTILVIPEVIVAILILEIFLERLLKRLELVSIEFELVFASELLLHAVCVLLIQILIKLI